MISGGRIAVLVWLAGLVVAILVVTRTPFTTDMSAFLPKAADPAQQVLVDQLRDGVASRLILIGIDGGDPAAREGVARQMARELTALPQFAAVDSGEGGIGKADRELVWRQRYLLSPSVTPDRFTPDGLRHALDDDLDLLQSGVAPLMKDAIPHDPTGETLATVQLLAGEAHRTIRDGAWVSPDGSRALVLAQTRAPGFDLDAQQQTLDVIGHAFETAQANTSGGSETHFAATGPGVFGVETRARMKHDVSLYSSLAMATIVGLLVVLYRSPTVLVFTLLPVATGALAGLAAVSLWSGFVHGITVGFGVTLIGEAVDYAIYLLTQTTADGGATGAMRRLWPTLRLGMLVSVCGFSAMLFSSFTGFMQLGVFTIAGLAAALAVTRFVLPAILPAGFTGTRRIALAPGLLRLIRHAARLRLALALVVVAAVAMIVWRNGDLWQDELTSMSPIPLESQALDRALRHDMGAPDVRNVVIATGDSREAVLRASEDTAAVLQRLTGEGAFTGYDSPDRYLPSERTQRARQEALPEPESLKQSLATALDGEPFEPATFAPFLADAAAAKTGPLMTRTALDGTALALKLDSLLVERNGRWVAVLPLDGVVDPDRIATALKNTSAQFLDLKTQSDLLLHRYRREALLLAGAGSLVIALLLLASFRSLRETFIVLLPLTAAVIVTIGLGLLGGGRLSVFNLFGLLLVVAVGSNYCLFFQRGGMNGEHGERIAVSLVMANLCTVIGFGALSLSRLPVLYGIGGTVAIGTALSLIAGAILMPRDRPDAMP